MTVIALQNVTLWRLLKDDYAYDLKGRIFSFVEGRHQKQTRKLVLDDINLEIRRGDKLGIIGPNGSGKSTLLKVMCGILLPTAGHVRMTGDVSPLLELGAGFDLELSVAENIILYGVLLGFSRAEMLRKIDGILEFAELRDYRSVPVKALSSGMAARLGFAVATDVEPDILMLDEVLSIGDEHFKHKCRRRIDEFWRHHVTILLVSHDLEFIRQACERAIWLDNGRIRFAGDARETVRQYLNSIDETAAQLIERFRRS